MPAKNPFPNFRKSPVSSLSHAIEIVPDDANDLDTQCRVFMVTSAGSVAVTTSGGDNVTLPALLPGVQYFIEVSRVHSTGTTASGIVGFW